MPDLDLAAYDAHRAYQAASVAAVSDYAAGRISALEMVERTNAAKQRAAEAQSKASEAAWDEAE